MEFINKTLTIEISGALGIILVGGLIAWLLYLLVSQIIRRLPAKTRITAIPHILESISKPIFFLVLIQGIIFGLKSISGLADWHDTLNIINLGLVIGLITYALAQISYRLMNWYGDSIAARTETSLDDTLLPLIQRVLWLVIYAIGGLVLLDMVGISITPMLTGLGLSGLAVALALQPTLASFFAGVQVITDQIVNIGDYIELDNGVRGYVTEIGWRSTRVRTPYQNMVIIPNSRLADSIITNYDSPHREVAVIVESGVSYSSDLAQVEEIVREVTAEVLANTAGAATRFEPWFGFDTFGESNINFWVWFYAQDYLATFLLKSELIKHLHARFNKEGIEINYPVRKLVQEPPPRTRPASRQNQLDP